MGVLDMVLLVLLDMVLLVLSELLVLSVMVVLLMLDMESVKLMLMLRPMLMLLMVLMDMLLLPQLPFPPHVVTVSQSPSVTRFPLRPQERSARPSARLSLKSPQLRTVRKPSPPPPNVGRSTSMFRPDTAQELLVMTPRLDPLLLLPPTVLLLLLLLPQLLLLLDMLEVLLLVGPLVVPQLLLDTLVLDMLVLDLVFLDTESKPQIYSLFRPQTILTTRKCYSYILLPQLK